MTMQNLIDRLLYEEESATLDFKSEQYRFSEASDEEKAELLKDIVAFANAWRRTDAYILVGVKEIKGERSSVIGIADHLDDSRLQQFVNAKTNRPIDFVYRTVEFEGVKLGVFQIPPQKRPFYLKNDFGRLKKEVVYIRRGSSTSTATPDEVVTMGGEVAASESRKPNLEAFLVHGKHDEFCEQRVCCQVVNVQLPHKKDIPDYRTGYSIGGAYSIPAFDLHENHEYYRDKAKYISVLSKTKGFKIGAKNTGEISAIDVKVVFDVGGEGDGVVVFEENKLPGRPEKNRDFVSAAFLNKSRLSADVSVKKTVSGWKVTCNLGKIQPQEIVFTTCRVFIGSSLSQSVKISASIFCDDLSVPKTEEFELIFDVEQKTVSIEELCKI